MRCRRWSRRPGLFYVLQIFLWTASFHLNTEIVAWSNVRRILWRFLTCFCHAFFFNVRELSWLRVKSLIYYWWRTCLWLAFRKQFAEKAYLKINLLVKTPLHRSSMEVRRSGLWAPDYPYKWGGGAGGVLPLSHHWSLKPRKNELGQIIVAQFLLMLAYSCYFRLFLPKNKTEKVIYSFFYKLFTPFPLSPLTSRSRD